ncbi:MAG: S4 domain-containing protein [Steroidobacteraceae bacterium]|jgi:ribosome-associated heat shock protein Hsp15|nr:S4 domain-containing protein [Steroidobacteraceae bacterium]
MGRRGGSGEAAEEGEDGLDPQRLDKWLWCARFYKSRSQAAEAVAGGRVHLNGQRVKPAHAVKPGDLVGLSLGTRDVEVAVLGLLARRGPATEARTAYEETPDSLARGERQAEHRRLAALVPRPEGRPGKHDRRELRRLHRGDD